MCHRSGHTFSLPPPRIVGLIPNQAHSMKRINSISVRDPKRSAFTLIELLVVISVIAILTALSVASMGRARRAANFSSSLSNLRQIGLGMDAYAVENDGYLPTWYNNVARKYWWEVLMDQLGLSKDITSHNNNYRVSIFRDPGDNQFDGASYDQLSLTLSYGYNYKVVGRTDGIEDSTDDGPIRANNFPMPSKTLVVANAPNMSSYGYIDYYGHGPDENRYQGQTGALFLDGHVEVLNINPDFKTETPYFNRKYATNP